MPEWTPRLLLFVFASHLPFFAWRYQRTRELRYAATSVTFGLLILAYGLRVFAPDATLDGVPLHQIARIPAWAAAVVSVGLLLHHAFRGVRSRDR